MNDLTTQRQQMGGPLGDVQKGRSMKRVTMVLAAGAALAIAPAAAQAHVTLQPESVPAGGFTRLDVRVPNELDDATTTKVEVQFPPGFLFASYEPVPGWAGAVEFRQLDEPAEAFGEEFSEEVDTVTFTAEGKGIQPGQFQDFGLSLSIPDAPGETLTFPALQTYSNSEVVRWIGEPDSEEPAPTVTLTEPESPAHGATEGEGGESDDEEHAESKGGEDDDGTDTLAVVALIVGGLGLLLGIGAMARGRGSA